MYRNIIKLITLLCIIAILPLAISACGGGGGGSSSNSSSSSSGGTTNGTIQLSMLDAPGDYDHVWITVKSVWFHTSSAAGPHDPAWLKYPLATPVTIDLIALSNGEMTQDLWNGSLQLPVGNYQQIRLLLVPTYTANPPAGHSYFNEVVVGSTTTPLRIPDADDGIRLVGSFQVANGTPLRLAIDFDAGDDVVDFSPTEYILKPRLAYFDLDNAGAIVGQLSTGGTFTTSPHFVIKAEKLSSDGSRHIVHRITVPDATGKFILYPLSATTNTTLDILVRGLGYKTTIIKNVPVTKGTTPTSSPTVIPLISMSTGTDYAGSGVITSPTGAWIDYFQTLPGAGEVPYEVRFRHFHPVTGAFTGFMLSNSQLQWGVYSAGSATIALTAVAPAEGTGSYQAIAGADDELYVATALPGTAAPNVSATPPASRLATFGTLTVMAPYRGNSVSGAISMATPTQMDSKMDTGVVFAVHGGMIVDAVSTARSTLSVSDVMTGGTYTMTNLPGGTTANPLPTAFYGIDAAFWSSTNVTYKAIAIPQVVDLRTGNDTADLQMQQLW